MNGRVLEVIITDYNAVVPLFLEIQSGGKKTCLAVASCGFDNSNGYASRDYHKFAFVGTYLESKNVEKRLLQSLGVRGFLTSLYVSIFLLLERDVKCQGGQRSDFPWTEAFCPLSRA